MWRQDFWMGGMWIFPLIVVLLFVGFMIFNRGGCRPFWRQDKTSYMEGQDETPLEILKKRYANGEISKEEFDKIRKDLT